MDFRRITIVGLGLIGGSLAAALRRKRVTSEIVGVDFPKVLGKARELGLISAGCEPTALERGIANADLVVLATPISVILEVLPEIGPCLREGAMVTDVGSTKAKIVATARQHLPRGTYFVGGHPMAGSERGGIDHIDPLLFENAVYVLTPDRGVPDAQQQKLINLIQTVGANVRMMSPEAHDRVAARVSHLPQILAVALMKFVASYNREDSSHFELAAGGFRDMTRVASSGYQIWQDILKTNSENIGLALSQFQSQLQNLSGELGQTELAESFRQAARDRDAIPRDSRGFLNPHFDIVITVEDKPGVIAEISGALSAEAINIKDIEIMKIREKEAGTMRLAFDTQANRKRAISLLSKRGYAAVSRD